MTRGDFHSIQDLAAPAGGRPELGPLLPSVNATTGAPADDHNVLLAPTANVRGVACALVGNSPFQS